MAYDIKYRKRVVEYRLEGHTIENTSKVFKVSESAVKEWVKQYREEGHSEKKPIKRKHKTIDPNKLMEYINEQVVTQTR